MFGNEVTIGFIIIIIVIIIIWLCSPARADIYLTTHTANSHAPGGIRTHDRRRRAAVDLRLRPRDHWDRRLLDLA
jgi:hypothetical protein